MSRILVIDDDEVTRVALGSVLEGADHEVSYAPNGEVGFSFYQREPFDLVIVDLAMPVKSGLRTIRELLEFDKTARIIAISGVSPEQFPLAEDYGALRTLLKPVKPPDLLEAVDGALRKSIGWDAMDIL
ncbi:MAG: response regulator [Gemmatimonadales bacterium]|nr:response regulator [Gemmatimonadales bacterium]NIN12352.1 response regulator [Gemmatimonadales bacterium]NIN48890.1 response regulator [Gemmatimonadales bacterium]NIP06354.1 response regulator [Gemmatimonadales bacterium]NIR00727.1 response regulator [Gemmatimonadales bacterium]